MSITGTLRDEHRDAEVPVTWLEANEPSYILYTSGTTGKPKGVQRDVGGYAVALASTMKYVYNAQPGETMFTTSDIGWVVGHSYIVYGPLLHGMTTIVYEGLPTKPDAGIWWKIVQDHKVTTMFSSPTAIRVLKKQDPAWLKKYDLSSLRYLFLAGEPLDETTSRWISDGLGVPVLDHYWQTETGWAMLSYLPGVELKPNRFGSPGFPAYGFNIRIVNDLTGEDCGPNEKGVLTVVPPLPPGCLTTVWGDDKRFINSYFGQFEGNCCTRRPTGHCATPTATPSSSAAPMTSSTPPATASARAKSRKPCKRIRPSPKSRWWVCTTNSRARCRSVSAR
jgi:propionyl-CoA synthetase